MAELNLTLPNITDAALQDARQVRQLKSYLFQLNDQLRYVLANLDEGNLSGAAREQFDGLSRRSKEALSATQEMQETTHREFMKVYDELVDTAGDITREFSVALSETINTIEGRVSEQYMAKGERAELEALLESYVVQTSQDITMNFNELRNYTTEVDGQLQELNDELRTYIRFDADGIELGKLGSAFLSRLSSSRLSFLQDQVEVAYVSNNKLYITDTEVNNKLTIGNGANGYFDWVPRANGNLSMSWRED